MLTVQTGTLGTSAACKGITTMSQVSLFWSRTIDYDLPQNQDQSYGPTGKTYSSSCQAADSTSVRTTPPAKTTPDKNGFRPYTAHSCSGINFESSKGSTKYVTRGGTGNYRYTDTAIAETAITSVVVGALPSAPALSVYQRNGLLTAALASAKEQSFNVATNLGELPEALAMLKSTRARLIQQIEDVVRDYIRKSRKRPAHEVLNDLLNNFGSIWLEYRFGWRPLVGSVQDLAKAVAKVQVGEYTVAVGRARQTNTLTNPSFTVTQQPYNSSSFFQQSLTWKQTTRVTYQASAAMSVSPVNAAFNADVVTTAWELIPASFLVDRVMRIGEFLQALGSGTEMSGTSTLSYSTKVDTAIEITGTSSGFPSSKTLLVPVTATVYKYSYNRVVVPSFTPTVRIVTPNLDVGSVTDLLTIVKQVFFKHFRST